MEALSWVTVDAEELSPPVMDAATSVATDESAVMEPTPPVTEEMAPSTPWAFTTLPRARRARVWYCIVVIARGGRLV
jgi:hypothetical protein